MVSKRSPTALSRFFDWERGVDMYCQKCGASLVDGSVYCHKCGAKYEEPKKEEPPKEEPPKNGDENAMLFTSIILLTFLIYFLYALEIIP
jgi:ribosomal protein L40E